VTTPLLILSIQGRTEPGNGVSRPFVCEAADGELYYVKLKNAGFSQLIKEWICGRMAQELGLPIAEFRQVLITEELVKGNPEWEAELGHGIAFGSRKRSNALDLRGTESIKKLEDIPGRILLFDRWVRNEDRKLTKMGGNPNCLWDVQARQVVLIDHDNAFDPDFSIEDFWKYHVFKDHREFFAAAKRVHAAAWLEDGIAKLPEIWDELPAEWLFDEYGDQRPGIDRIMIETVLSSFRNPGGDFWKTNPETP
jgi:hypothetical protein